MYLADFATTPEGDRFFVTIDLKSGKTRIERVSNEALERFIRNVISLGEDRTMPSAVKGVSA